MTTITLTNQQLSTILNQTEIVDRPIREEFVSEKTDIVSVNADSEDCYMCLEKLNTKSNYLSLCCGHKIHFTCFIKNAELGTNPDNCGYCRQKLVSDELITEIRKTKRESRIQRQRDQDNYLLELQQEQDRFNQEDVFDNLPDLPVSIPNPPPLVRRPRRRRQTGNARSRASMRLVESALNQDTGNNETYQTIPEIRRRIIANNQSLSEATISSRIRELVDSNRVEVGRAGGNRRNYRLVLNSQRHA